MSCFLSKVLEVGTWLSKTCFSTSNKKTKNNKRQGEIERNKADTSKQHARHKETQIVNIHIDIVLSWIPNFYTYLPRSLLPVPTNPCMRSF